MTIDRLAKLITIILLVGLTACSPIDGGTGGGFPNSSGGGGSTGGNSGGGTLPGLPSGSFRQTPGEITFHGCPPQGDGGDPVLNENKNRVDNGNYQPTAFNTILNLSWPQETERRAHADWSASAQAQVAQAEGLPVAVEGYLALARLEGPETPNCHSTTDADFHIWMIGHAGGSADRAQSVVVEATPRVRTNHPQWTVNNLIAIAQAGTKVRISGWLMLDPEHPEQLAQTRGTLWEVHPVMQIEISQNGQWVALDNGSVPQAGNNTSKSTTSAGNTGNASCPDIHASCSQLTCDQAYACLAAGDTALDGNGDGIPCNSQCAK